MLGLGLGIVIVTLIFVFVGVVILRETATQRFWRRKVDEGDLEMVTQLVQIEVAHWRTERAPKGVPAAVWQGIQGVEIVEVTQDSVHASTTAEPQFALVGGERRQVTSALDEARRIIAKLIERFFYDIPHVRFDRVQLDCYSTFHDASGAALQRCILSVAAGREDVTHIDWEQDSPEVIAAQLGARYEIDERGSPRPIEPEAPRVSANGARNGQAREQAAP
jgi:hypothetical protein